MARLIDIEPFLAQGKPFVNVEALKDAPCVDLVYCKDCKHLRDGLFCTEHHFSDGGDKVILSIIQDKMFCAEGERR